MSISSLNPAALGNPNVAKTGTITGGPHGDVSFSRTVARTQTGKSIDSTRTLASGRVVEDQITVTQNADGSTTRVSTTTGAHGQTSSSTTTYSAPVDGVRTITGTRTKADGSSVQVAGSSTDSNGSKSRSVTTTDAAGETATTTSTSSRAGGVTTRDISHTDYSGQTNSFEELVTLLT